MSDRIQKPVYSAPSPIHGKGLYAKVAIGEGEYIGTYRGYRTSRDGRHVLWVTEDGRSIGRNGLNLLRYLNHSDEPNASFDGFDLFAKEDIEPGDEITINYEGDTEDEEE